MFDAIEDFIKSFFGKGKLVFHIKLNTGRTATVKQSYVGSLDTVNMEEVKAHTITETSKLLRPLEFVTDIKYIRNEVK